MAVIGTIRNKFGTILLIFIGFALAAFVLGDFFKSANKIKAADQNLMGEVNGEKIYYNQFDRLLEVNLTNEKNRQKKTNLTGDQVFRIKEQTWNQIIERVIMGNEREELGVTVTADELFDLMQGDDPHPYIKQSFKNQETGEYDPEQVRSIMKRLDTFTPQQQEEWTNFQNQVKDNQIETKYNSLISSAYHFPKVFLERDFDDKKNTATVRVLAYRIKTSKGHDVELTDADYQKYYDQYKDNYRREEEMRDLKYVIFQVKPSAEDRVALQKLTQDIYKDFRNANNAYLFANSESESPVDTNWKAKGELDLRIDNIAFGKNVQEGQFIPPFFHNNTWTMGKIVKLAERPDSLKASHILISYSGAYNSDPKKVTRIKVQAKNLADSLFAVISKNSSKMEELMTNSDDPSAAQNKGDLGWFKDGTMVPAFNEAVINTEVGNVVMVETVFGYHIIKVEDKTEAKPKAKIALITKELTPSRETNEKMFAEASDFQIKSTTPKIFDTLAKSLNLGIRKAADLNSMSSQISGLESPRHIVQWAFKEDTEEGDVSEVYSFTDKFIVFIVEKIKAEGYPPLKEVKSKMKNLVTKAVKVDKLAKELSEKVNNNKDINALATELNLKVDTLKVNFSMRSLPRYGAEEKVMGEIFALETGKLSNVIKGNNAAFLVIVDEMVKADADAKKDIYESQLVNTFKRKVTQKEPFNALKEKAEIDDNRARFY